jgi:hypothetical protein
MKNAGRTSQSGPRSKSGNQQSASNNANWTMNQYLLNRQFQQQASMQNQNLNNQNQNQNFVYNQPQ